jgi:L-threonylcarbamoyladenylate synthase
MYICPQLKTGKMESEYQTDLEHCLDVLEKGGIILYPTDTVWGLGCDACNPAAVDRIFRIKQRPPQKAMIILVADQKDIIRYVAGPDPGIFDYLQTVKKPTTVIYEGALGLADNLPEADGSIAIRVVRDDFCRHLIKRFKKPLVSTSANISGQPAPAIFGDISAAILSQVDYVVHYRREDRQPASPSALVRWQEGKPIVIRP